MNIDDKTDQKVDRVSKKQETIRELAKRHMMDKNHTTTDEELRNVVVEFETPIYKDYRSSAEFQKK